jgi:hypothetical protein
MKLTYSDILKWNNTIARWKQQNDIHLGINGSQIKFVEKKIAFPVRAIITGMNTLTKKYFFFENGDVKYTGEGKDAKPVMKQGMKYEDYEAEKAKFLATEIEVKL